MNDRHNRPEWHLPRSERGAARQLRIDAQQREQRARAPAQTRTGRTTPESTTATPPKKREVATDASSPDVVVPLVFPDYLIGVDPVRDVPDWGQSLVNHLLPGSDAKKGRIAGLGHAGVLFFRGSDGLTKYYEYGRYDPAAKGLVEKRPMPDVVMKGGVPTPGSLAKTLAKVSALGGHGTRVMGCYIMVPGKFDAMLDYVEGRRKLNTDPNRDAYSITRYNCMTFAKETADAAGVDTPFELIHQPNSYMADFRDQFRTLDWNKTAGLVLGPETTP